MTEMTTEYVTEDDGLKKGRRRKKQLYSSILQQMEFYFSDSNLTKDRFLSKLTQEDPYVDISVFLQFNKLCKLTTSLKDITKALTKSNLLELSEDKTKVKRKLPVQIKENIEECTLYVEQLKSDATHEWLSTIFSEFGNVTYVSIPKYKPSGMIKGFGFVEFEKEESVQAALQCFESIGCKIPTCMEPEKLSSIVTYNIERNANSKKKQHSGLEDLGEPIAKKAKINVEDNEQSNDLPKTHVSCDLPVVDTQQEISTSEEKKKKKQKKAHKKKMHLKELGLRILSKKDWKKMRNRYLDMQRKSMKELKMHLNRQRFAAKYETHKPNVVNDIPSISAGKKDVLPTQIEFVPKVIVKLTLQEACYAPKPLRKKIKTYSPEIKYVEVPFGSTDAYLRFGDSQSAEEFCSSDFKDKAVVLEGEEEKNYWGKIEESAVVKKDKQMKTNKKRGRDKLLKKAEKHIANHMRFNEEGGEG